MKCPNSRIRFFDINYYQWFPTRFQIWAVFQSQTGCETTSVLKFRFMGIHFFGLSLHVSLHVWGKPSSAWTTRAISSRAMKGLMFSFARRAKTNSFRTESCYLTFKSTPVFFSQPLGSSLAGFCRLARFGFGPGEWRDGPATQAAGKTRYYQELVSVVRFHAVTIPPRSIWVWNRFTVFQGWQGIDERWLFRSLVQLCGVWHFVDLFGEKGPPRTSPKDWWPG